MAKDPGEQAKPLTDTALEDVEGGVYVQEYPSGAKKQPGRKGAVLQFDEDDAVAPQGTPWAVFEPNDEP